ncbi:MAG: hypothetical protein KGL26_01115 [Pseudomonadota bacterium]|nr:hypothetical protein [Pseudomonadota bacterium]
MSNAEALMEQLGRELVEHPEKQMRQAGELLLAAAGAIQAYGREGGSSQHLWRLVDDELLRNGSI